jgi:NitT/TauT family transport system permease protein
VKVKQFFALRGKLPPLVEAAVQVVGSVLFVAIWHLVAISGVMPNGILPTPWRVFTSFGDLLREGVILHAWQSIKLNLLGYAEAVVICLPLGFLVGLNPLFSALSERLLAAARFLPLPAALGLFIAAFGIGTAMKVHFLAVGIIVYLLPTVVSRVKATDIVYEQTARTLGGNTWQVIRYVFIPDVNGRVFDDVGILLAISWTYITIAEVINSSEGGLGALAYIAGRQSRSDKIFAILLIIAAIGLTQDWIRRQLDRWLFAYKY